MSLNDGMFSSEYDSWCTPQSVLERVRRVGPIKLDPCGNAQSIVNAAVEWRLARGQDALVLNWSGHGLCFVNPPYGDQLGPFMRRMAIFGGTGVEIIGLVPHRTDTAWYQENLADVRAKCEWRGRMKFLRGQADQAQLGLLGDSAPLPAVEGEASAPFPTVLLYWGRRPGRFVKAFADAGQIWSR